MSHHIFVRPEAVFSYQTAWQVSQFREFSHWKWPASIKPVLRIIFCIVLQLCRKFLNTFLKYTSSIIKIQFIKPETKMFKIYMYIYTCRSITNIQRRPLFLDLTHWGRLTHICVSKLAIISSDNGLSPARRQAIIFTNAGILLTGPLGTNSQSKFMYFYTRKCIGNCRPKNGGHFVSASTC